MSDFRVDSETLDRWLNDTAELAVLDLREEADFVQHGAPLFASNLPYSRLEATIHQRVPRKSVRIVLVDGGDGVADRAATQLAALGYGNVKTLAGGLPAWRESGKTAVFSESPGQFTQRVREQFGTPSVLATELNELYAKGGDVVVLDSRTVEEYTRNHVPGAVSAPGGELVHRFVDLVPSPETLVLVSCAGNPRGVIGAQTLINAGVPNRVAVLEEGTKGWTQAGLELETGLVRPFGPVSEQARSFAQKHAAQLEEKFEVQRIDTEELGRWIESGEERTTYLLDVRTPEEFAQGHHPHALSAPGGQLILGTLRYVGVRGARLVLLDDTGVRAATTAHWLRLRGWEVRIHEYDSAAEQPAVTVQAGRAARESRVAG